MSDVDTAAVQLPEPDNGAVGQPQGCTGQASGPTGSSVSVMLADGNSQTSDPPIVNEPLCYITNKIEKMPADILVKLCSDFYNDEQIDEAKAILYDTCTRRGYTLPRMVKRRETQQPKRTKDLNDILQIVLELETENTPIFLARNLSNLPPLSYNHFDLGKIINDIEALKNDMQIAVHVAKSHDEILRAVDQLTKRCDERSQCGERPTTAALPHPGKAGPSAAPSPRTCSTAAPVTNDESDDSITAVKEVIRSSYSGRCGEMHQRTGPSTGKHVNALPRPETAGPFAGPSPRPCSTAAPVNNDESDDSITAVKEVIRSSHTGVQDDDDGDDEGDGTSDLVRLHVIQQGTYAQVTSVGRPTAHATRVFTSNRRNADKSTSSTDKVIIGESSTSRLKTANRGGTVARQDSRVPIGIFVTRLHRNTTETNVDCNVRDETGRKVNSEKIVTKFSTYASFLIRCNGRIADTLLSTKAWPKGALVKRFYEKS